MTIPTKKLNTGFEIPVFAFGTWEMGGRTERVENYNPEEDIKDDSTIIYKKFIKKSIYR